MASFVQRAPELTPIYEHVGIRMADHALPLVLGWMWCRLTNPSERERLAFVEAYYKHYLLILSNSAHVTRKILALFNEKSLDAPLSEDSQTQLWMYLYETLAASGRFNTFSTVNGTPEMDVLLHIGSAVLDMHLHSMALRILFLLMISASTNQWATIWAKIYHWPHIFTNGNPTYKAVLDLAAGPAPSASFFGALITDIIQTIVMTPPK